MKALKTLFIFLLFVSLQPAFAAESLGPLPDHPQEYIDVAAMQNYYYTVEPTTRKNSVRFMCQLRRPTPAEMWVSGRGSLFVPGNLLVFKPGISYGRATFIFKSKQEGGAIFFTPPVNTRVRCFEI